MSTLASFLKAHLEEQKLSLRDMEQRAGVSKALLSNLINGKDIEPKLSTLEGIARAIGLPLWRIVEMTGVSLGLPETPSEDAERLASLAQSHSGLQRLIHQLALADAQQIRNVLGYLEALGGGQVHDLRVTILSDRQREMVGRLLRLQPTLLPDLPPRQNVYEGANLANERGAPIWAVRVNGVDLAETLGWQRDFAWGYLGSGPMALAEGMLRHEYGPTLAETYRSTFYSDVVSTLPQGRERSGRIWSLESQELDLWLILTRLIQLAEQPHDAKAAPPVISDSQPG